MTPLLKLEHIRKSFGPVQALRGVDMDIYSGEVHALIGENGAGKSTLMKILSGAYQADSGRMWLEGQSYRPESPRDGRVAGIHMIYQELTIAPHLTVGENIVLGLEEATLGWLRSHESLARDALDRLGQRDIGPDTTAGKLPLGKQQIIECARVLVSNSRVVVMDEPTSSLSAADAEALFDVIRRLKENGVAVIYISHFLEEVLEVGDRFTVLRDGETTAAGSLAGKSLDELIPPMIGRPVEELYPISKHHLREPLLTVSELTGFGDKPSRVDFTVRRGEILGIAGLVGAGRSETLRTLFGLHHAQQGRIRVGDTELLASRLGPARALDHSLHLLSENRKKEGLATGLSLRENLTLSGLGRYVKNGFLDLRRERASARKWIERLDIRSSSPDQKTDTLSGGNQQKLCLARLLHDDSEILLLDEPTRGIDIGSKAEMYRLIHEAAASGKVILMTSSYLPELFGVCDTLGVMFRGALSEVRPVDRWTEEEVLHFATSGKLMA